MTHTQDRERARRDAIEKAYRHPDPVVPKHDSTNAERPRTAASIKATLIGHGFEIEEKSATIYGTPQWKTVKPDDPNLSYVSEPVVVYHLGAQRLHAKVGQVKAVDVLYVAGKVARSRIGYAKPGGRGEWHKTPVMSVAKLLREALNT